MRTYIGSMSGEGAEQKIQLAGAVN